MGIETRSMKRAALRRAGLEPDVTAATPVATTTTTANTALTASQRRVTAPKAARGKIAVKGKVSADKVQKGARAKKGGKKAIGRPKKKARGRQVADGDDEGEVEESEPERKPESEPEPEPKPKPVDGGRGKAKGGNGASKVQKTTANKKPSVQKARKAKQKARGKKTAEEEEVKDEKSEPGRESGTEPKPKPVTEGRGTAKSRKASNKVQKSVGTRSQPARNSKQKAEGNEEADENVVENQEPDQEPQPEPESEQEQRKELARLVNKWKKKPRVPKSTKPKKGGIKAVPKAKKEAKANEVTHGSEPKDQNSVSEGAGKGLDPAVPEADKANKDQAQTPGKEKGKEKPSVPHKTRERLVQRFTRAELQEALALEWEEVQEPTLTNEIHPIWAIEKFRFSGATNTFEPEIVYSAIAPALRLASLWAERPKYEDFWYRLWGGKYEKRKVMMQILRNEELQNDILREQLVQDESASSNLVRNEVLDSFQCEWRFGPQASGEWWTMKEGIAGFSGCVTTLHEDFERLAYTYQPETTTSERLRFYFFFAVNLVRALVQQVCQFKRREKFGHDVEPIANRTVFFRDSRGRMVPLEEAWERAAFRGVISQINTPTGPMAPDGLAAYVHVRKDVSRGRVYEPLRMDWISGRFSAIHWVDEDGEIELDNGTLWKFAGPCCYAKALAID